MISPADRRSLAPHADASELALSAHVISPRGTRDNYRPRLGTWMPSTGNTGMLVPPHADRHRVVSMSGMSARLRMSTWPGPPSDVERPLRQPGQLGWGCQVGQEHLLRRPDHLGRGRQVMWASAPPAGSTWSVWPSSVEHLLRRPGRWSVLGRGRQVVCDICSAGRVNLAGDASISAGERGCAC